MPQFKSIEDIEKYIKANLKTVTLSNGKTMPQIIESEAERLSNIIRQKINEYYMSYDPKVYERTYDMINSLQVEKSIVNGNEISVRVYFDDSANHPSVFGQEDGFSPWLINHGWRVQKGNHMNIEHFGYQKGARFIENAIAEFNKNNPYGFRIRVRVDVPDFNYDSDYTGGLIE